MNRFAVFPRVPVTEDIGSLNVTEYSTDALYFGIEPNWCTDESSLCTLDLPQIRHLYALLTEFLAVQEAQNV